MIHGIMSNPVCTIIIFILTLSGSFKYSSVCGQITDTASVNYLTRSATLNARKNPDMSIELSHKALSESGKIQYRKGMADASFALGTAYLAKYNINDSAFYYNMQAYNIYNDLNDTRGKARACYGLTYV